MARFYFNGSNQHLHNQQRFFPRVICKSCHSWTISRCRKNNKSSTSLIRTSRECNISPHYAPSCNLTIRSTKIYSTYVIKTHIHSDYSLSFNFHIRPLCCNLNIRLRICTRRHDTPNTCINAAIQHHIKHFSHTNDDSVWTGRKAKQGSSWCSTI